MNKQTINGVAQAQSQASSSTKLTKEFFEANGIEVTDRPPSNLVPNQVTPPNARTSKEFQVLINGSSSKNAQGFIDTGQYLCEAKDELDKDEFEAMVRLRLAFSESTARRLMLIAQHRVICARVHKLPPCWGTIYELTKLADEELLARFADGSTHPNGPICPGMKRSEVRPRTRPNPAPASNDDAAQASAGTLLASWEAASTTEHIELLMTVGVPALLSVMPDMMRKQLTERLLGQLRARCRSDNARSALDRLSHPLINRKAKVIN